MVAASRRHNKTTDSAGFHRSPDTLGDYKYDARSFRILVEEKGTVPDSRD